MSLLKKFTLAFLSFLVLFGSLAPNLSVAKAADTSTWYDQSFPEWFGKVYDTKNPSEIFGERYTTAQVQWIIYGLFSLIVPDKGTVACVFTGDVSTCFSQLMTQLGIADASSKPNLATKHENLASLVFASDRPLSFISYLKNLGQKYTLISEVHAQNVGFGYGVLSVIQSIWVSARNIVYGLFVLMAVILAFMIMFRVKISPQVVISAQSAIPKLILALILVTFSYAIAGFLIDLMYVVIGLISLALANTGGVFATDPATIFKFLTTGYVGINSNIGLPLGIVGMFFLYVILFSITAMLALFLGNGGVFAAITLPIIAPFTMLVGIVVFVIMMIIVIFIGIKTAWMLIKAFAQVLLLTIAAPFQIGFGTIIPGMGFGSWLKSFAANLAIFPVTGLFMALSFMFLKISLTLSVNNLTNINAASLINLIPIIPGIGSAIAGGVGSNNWPPLLNGPLGMTSFIFLGASFMVFTLIPKAGDVIKGFMTGRPFAYGTAIGEAFGSAKWAGNQAWDKSGGKDYWGALMQARRARRTVNALEENEPLSRRVVGGTPDQSKNAVNATVKKAGQSEGDIYT